MSAPGTFIVRIKLRIVCIPFCEIRSFTQSENLSDVPISTG